MKIRLIASLLLCVGLFASGQAFAEDAAGPYVQLGLNDLTNQDIVDANSNFEVAVSVDPTDGSANVLLAATRLLVLEQSSAGSNFLSGLGVAAAGRDYYDWTARPETNSKGKAEFPPGYNSGTGIAFYTNTVMPAITASLTNLANVTDTTFQLVLPPAVTTGGAFPNSDIQSVTVDYGDVQVMRAMLTAAEFFGYTVTANNANADLSWIETNIQNKTLTFQALLNQFPSLGAKQTTAAFTQSESVATNAIDLYFGAANFILDDRTVTNALFNLSTNDIPEEVKFQTELTNILLSLTAPTQFASNNVSTTIYLAPYFDGDVSLRGLIPKFNGDAYVPDSVPDYTFGGILPDQPAAETEGLLLAEFPNYAGIYEGVLSDNSGNNGGYAVYVATNGQLTVVGYDNGDQSFNDPTYQQNFTTDGSGFGIFAQATLNKGNWQNSNSVYNAYGSVSQDGQLNGEIDYSNGVSIFLNTGYEQSSLGTFQNFAGYYTGTFSGSISGSLYSIVDASGNNYFATSKSGPGGYYGGDSALYNSDNDFQDYEANGTYVYGILDTNSVSVEGTNYFYPQLYNTNEFYSVDSISPGDIDGIYTNVFDKSKGTFSLSRSSSVVLETPPVITTNLPLGVAVALGSTTTFQVGASGSAPLSYQWYFDGNPVPGAVSNKLVVTDNLWTTTGNYTIAATVDNAVGGTTSELCSVTVETTIPPIADYAGIFEGNTADGTNGIYDSLGYENGAFLAYVTTNGQVTVVGQDGGDNTGDGTGFGIYFQASLNSGGYFQTNNSYFTANGQINNEGGFYAQLYYPQANNGYGESVYLYGYVESPFGPFETSDGLYTGNYSGTQSGTADVILDANGDLSLEPLSSSANGNPFGNAQNGVSGQFLNSTDFSLISFDGTTVAGVLNPTSFVINGIYTNSVAAHGVFTVTRSSKLLEPVPPTITANLPASLTLPLGNTASFDFGVSGSAPLSFQWFFNGSLVSFATTNTLVVSNNLWTAPGTYTISATAANSVGTNYSQVCTVTVTGETNIPTLTITSPTSGQLWSNSTFTVTGTASDKVGLIGVSVLVNGSFVGGQLNNDGTWDENIQLTPGSNTISAFAQNVGGNESRTSTVLMDYVVTAPLTVITNGNGTLSQNDNGQLLRVGSTYSLTATPASGFGFISWSAGLTNSSLAVYTNSPTVIFTMTNGLVLQANFGDALKPYLKITNPIPSLVLVTNLSSYTVMGVATDDEEVATVNYTFNGAPTTLPIYNKIASWQAPVTLTLGTNVFSAYAFATNGNYSATDTVDIVNISAAQLVLQLSGKGTISPNYSNQLLTVGQDYTMTATPATGFKFINWTGETNLSGPFVLYGTNAALKFMMETGLVLQANFNDSNPPYLRITNPIASVLLVTNLSSYTVMGVATDDEEVASVNYSFNGTPSTLAISTNIAGWQVPLALTLGTNVFSAYALATNGNYSTTDTVDIVNIFASQLVLQTSGKGTFSPNYSNSLLTVGQDYTMTTTPAAGFKFINWTGKTNSDSPFVLYGTNAALKFLMETGLVLQANFKDLNSPYLRVTNPISTVALVTNLGNYTVMGVATDDEEIASVNYSFNHASYTNAMTNGIQWSSLPLPLMAATNLVSVYAEATNGNYSLTDTVELVNYSPNPLTVVTNGRGTITPANFTNGVLLNVGFNYTMTATPAAGFYFTNWLGSIDGTPVLTNKQAAVTFMMQTGLVLQANFVDTLKPYLKITNPISTVVLVTNLANYTVMGVATDDEEVASVDYSFNHGAYTNATTSGIQWSSASLSLMAGTNLVSVYAQATNGNYSATDTVEVVEISPNALTLVTNGKGTITPATYTNGVLLDVGFNYSLTATPASGFYFTNWTGTIGVGGPSVLTNKLATVTFMMQTGLVLQANFVDTLKPYLKITNPISTVVLVTNLANYTVMGVATDDEEVASVDYSFNHGAYTNATTSGIQWSSASLSLMAGTNLVSVYAQATNGNYSATDTVEVVEISPNALTLVTNGKGTITPATYTNGVLLDVGFNYSLTATPASGFYFTNWTGTIGVGGPSVLTNKQAAVTFMMQTGLVLQANFVDTLKPYLKITNPISTVVLVTNLANYTVMGVATDDEEVASVDYSFNHGAYTNATTSGIQWSSASLSLMAGTNLVSVYAQATNGNYSATDTVEVVEISPNALTLVTNGKGTITPATYTNGVLLDVGFNYSLTATPASGFYFTNWTGTIGVGGPSVLTNKLATVTFMMQTGLVLQANFVDTLKPYLKITNPISSVVLVTNLGNYTVMGVATDDEEIASVNYSLNGGSYGPATTNGIQWTASLASLAEGTNIFDVYALATNGNTSATNSLTIIRNPAITTFLIATNPAIEHPQAQMAFDGTNYLVVYQESGAVGQFISTNGALEGAPLQLNPGGQDDPPYLDFDGSNYLVAWVDYSSQQAGAPVKGIFVSPATQEPIGNPITLSQSTTVDNMGAVTYGGGVYFLMWSDDRATADSIYGEFVTPSGTTNGDFLISANGDNQEVAGPVAAFDGTNFLAVWSTATNNFIVRGQLISPSTGLVGNSFTIYTNTTLNGFGLPSVVFEGTNYLVLFNTGVSKTASSSAFHILGRLVTTAGDVLTNQVTVTSDAGPQIAPGVDFDGINFLASWNQGWSPFTVGASGFINGRFSNSQGSPTTAEFPIFTTPGGGLTWTFAPVVYDGSKFVLVGGLGKQIEGAASGGGITFTNGAIYGAFVKP